LGSCPETVTKLRANVVKAGLKDAPEDCAGLLEAIYSATDRDPTQQKQGNNTLVTQTARRIDGEWKLVDVTN
jgi:hypothetical protein